MRLVYSDPNGAFVHIAKGVLEQNGIRCLIRHDHLQNTVSFFLPHDTWVELWVLDDRQFEQARALLTKTTPVPDEAFKISCRLCGGNLESYLERCSYCGAKDSDGNNVPWR